MADLDGPGLIDAENAARPTLREAQRAATRAHLLGAARRVFEEHGYLAPTVEEILAAAGASRATFYAHFGGKAEIILQVMEQTDEELRLLYQDLDAALVGGRSDSLREWIIDAIAWMQQRSGLSPAWEQAVATDPAIRASRDGFFERVRGWLPRYFAAVAPDRQAVAALRVQLLVTLITAYCSRMAAERTAADGATVAEELTAMWYEPLREGLAVSVGHEGGPDQPLA